LPVLFLKETGFYSSINWLRYKVFVIYTTDNGFFGVLGVIKRRNARAAARRIHSTNFHGNRQKICYSLDHLMTKSMLTNIFKLEGGEIMMGEKDQALQATGTR
jgi:hypothetical protein